MEPDVEKDIRQHYSLDTEVFDLSERAEELTEYFDSLTIPEEVDREVVMGLVHEVSMAYVALANKLDLRAKELIDY